MLTRIDHVGIACRNLAEKIAFYESVFGLRLVSTEINEQQGVREAMLQVSASAAGMIESSTIFATSVRGKCRSKLMPSITRMPPWPTHRRCTISKTALTV